MVWGTTFPAMKDLTAHYSPMWIIFVRFAIAGLLLSPFLWRARRDDLVSGALLGLLLFVCFVSQVEGLALTSSNRNAFICGLNVLLVPLLGIFAGRWPERRIVLALVLAVSGLALLCWDGGAWGRGDTLALVCAFCFAVYVRMMAERTKRAYRIMALTASQLGTVGLCAGLWLAASGQPFAIPELGRDFYNVTFLAVVCTAAIISLQSWGQSRASANEAAVIYAFEPAAAAFFAFFWLGETMSARGWLGGVLLISGMIVSQWNSESRPAAVLAPE